MNKNLMMVMDNQMNPGKYSKEQLIRNASEAAVDYSNAGEYLTSDVAAIVDAAAYVASYTNNAAIEYWLDQYFEVTKENKQDYIDEINKEDKQ